MYQARLARPGSRWRPGRWSCARVACAGVLLAAALLLAAGPLRAQTIFKSPDSVRAGLRIMNQVVRHTGQLIASKTYDQLPHERREFDEGLDTLQEGIGNQPADFKTKLGPLIAKARVASSAISEAAQTHNDAALGVSHGQFAAAVKALTEAFPEELRPRAPAAPARNRRARLTQGARLRSSQKSWEPCPDPATAEEEVSARSARVPNQLRSPSH
jgi:hypothetical protein